jgi:ATP-dependent DNA ligase
MAGESCLQKGTRVYYMFDLIKLGSVDLRGEPLKKMKEKLKRLLKSPLRLLYVDHIEQEGLSTFAGTLALGLEAIAARDPASPYVEGPRETSHWLKIKDREYHREEPVKFNPPRHS